MTHFVDRYWRLPGDLGGHVCRELFYATAANGGYVTVLTPSGRKLLVDPKDLTPADPPLDADPQGGTRLDRHEIAWQWSAERHLYVSTEPGSSAYWDWLHVLHGPLTLLVPMPTIALPWSWDSAKAPMNFGSARVETGSDSHAIVANVDNAWLDPDAAEEMAAALVSAASLVRRRKARDGDIEGTIRP